MHPRTKMRKAIVNCLKQGKIPNPGIKDEFLTVPPTDAGDRVFNNRPSPLFTKWESPAIFVFSTDESSDHEVSAPRIYKRETEIMIEIFVATDADNDFDFLMDRIAEQVENILLINRHLKDPETLKESCEDFYLTGTAQTIADGGNQFFGSTRMTFRAQYDTDVTAGFDILAAGGVDIDWDVSQDGEVNAEDTINFEG